MIADWQLDLMIQNERERIWEKMNASDPADEQMRTAAVEMKSADEHLSVVIDRLVDATKALKGTPMQDKVESFLCQIEELQCDLFALTEKYGRGERE
jgi:hypothetical protein